MVSKIPGAYGKVCFECIHYHDKTCMGCFAEFDRHLEISCIFYNCVKDKNVPHCLRCLEYPCKLHKSISGLYSPLYRQMLREVK
ncbi:MAG: DUF3795 domain-containing protein [Methanocellales archaeon]|nr:DUF3795 domain-containing protein [Methanocellales archaeon]MDI6902356.1 DUF3795 domain-containing protein [Methanocellales archaeon]